MSTTINHKQVVLDGNYRTTVLQLEAIESALPAFTVLGKRLSDGAITATAVADGDNTGDGTLTMDVSTPTLTGVKTGAYKVKVTRAYEAEGSVAGAFTVTDPAGNAVGTAGEIGTAWTTQLKFTLAEGENTKFDVGDFFIITVVQTLAGDLVAWDPEANDGRQVPYAILAEDAEAGDEQFVSVYLSGRFNADEIVVPEGYTAENVFDGLREKGILLVHQADIGRNPAVVE